MFPGEDDRTDMGTLFRQPVRRAVAGEEKGSEQAEPGDGAAPRPRLRFGRGQRYRHHSAQAEPLDPLGEGHGEDAPFVDALLPLLETGGGDKLVHFGLRAAAHDPGLAAAMAGQGACDQFELRVPGLVGIDQIAARRDRGGQPGERTPHHRVVLEKFVKPGNDGESGRRLDRRQAVAIEGVALDEAGNSGKPAMLDQLPFRRRR